MANDFSSDSSCVALWRFESGALTTDSKGSHTLTAVGTPAEDTSVYKEGSCSTLLVRTDGDYYEIADADLSADFPLKSGSTDTQGTICGWVRFTNFGSVQNYGLWGKIRLGDNSIGMFQYNGSLYFDWDATWYSITSLTAGRWYHIGFTFDLGISQLVCYLWDDTAQTLTINTRDAVGSITVTSDPFRLGNFTGTTHYHNGNLDEIVVFNRILSALEIEGVRQQTYPQEAQVRVTSAKVGVVYTLSTKLSVTAAKVAVVYSATPHINLHNNGIASSAAFGTANVWNLDQDVLPSSVASSEAFGTPTVENKNKDLYPSSIASSTAFGAPIVDRGRWTFPTNRININAAITYGAAWNTVDVSSYVPAGTRAVLLQVRDTDAAVNSYYSHTRPTGSADTLNSLQRHLSQKTLLVALDSSRTFEGYFSDANLDVAIIAYTSTNNIGTTLTDKSLGTAGSWQLTDCSAIIPTTATFAVGFSKNNSGALNWTIGYRRSDDTTSTRGNNFAKQIGGTGFFQVKDASFYQYISYKDMDTYIYGYLDHDEAVNFPIPVSLKVPLVEDSWNRNFDFSPWVSSNAIAVILAIGDSGLSTGWALRGNAQHVDSTDDIYVATETGGGQTTGRVIVTAGLDDNLCADVYMGHGANYDILLLGYFIDPTLPKAVQFVEDTGITSSEAFGTAIVSVSQDVVVDSGIASAEAFGTADVGFPGIECTGIESAEAFGTPNVGAQAITVSSITSAEAFGTASLTSNISVSSITSAEAFGTAQLNQNVTCSSIESTEAFGTAYVYNTVEVPSIASTEAFGSTVVWLQEQYVTPDGMASAEAFGTAQLDQNITCTGIESAEAIGSHTFRYVTRIRNLIGIASGEAFGTPVVVPGPVTIEHSSLSSTEAFGTAHVKLNITEVGQIGSSEAFGTAQLGWGIHPVGIASLSAFGTARLDLNIPALGGVTSGEAFGTAHVKHQINGITGIVSLEALGTPHVKHEIQPVGIASVETFGDAAEVVTWRPGTDIFLKRSQAIRSKEAFGTAHVKLNIVADSPIVSSETFGTPQLSYTLGKPYWGTVKIHNTSGSLNVAALSGGVLHIKPQDTQKISVRSVTGMTLRVEMDKIEGQA